MIISILKMAIRYLIKALSFFSNLISQNFNKLVICGKITKIGKGCKFFGKIDVLGSTNIQIGSYCSFGKSIILNAKAGEINIGTNCKILNGVEISSMGKIEISSDTVLNLFSSIRGNFINIGKNVWISRYSSIEGDGIIIEDGAIIGPNVTINSSTHKICEKTNLVLMESIDSKPVKICKGSWIGAGAVILRGVTIGEGAIIGSNSVVTKDIPAYEVHVGIPAKFLKSTKIGNN